AALEQAIARDDRATIKTILKDAVPEFGSTAAGPPSKLVVASQHHPLDPSTTAALPTKALSNYCATQNGRSDDER
ncbi:hypothetical protein ABIC08_007790, partial [Bradyrhizobium sp. RT9b]|uniref:hypothetical protein n=1 Tax=unclassified Bradyrhizobium TaxID=2631580 RepID=UPI003399AC55